MTVQGGGALASTQSYPAESAAAAAVDFGRDVGVSARSLGRQVLRSSPFTYLTSLLMPRRSRRYFWAWYAYIRWVDDFVDEGLKPQNERTAFVDRQLDLIRASKGRIPIRYKEEQLLDAVLAYDTARGGMLRAALLDLLSSIRFDGQRVGEPADHATLHSHHEREVVSWLYTIAYFCEVPAKIQSPPGAQAAIGAKTAHVIRDFLRDCDERLFNVSRQEIAAYGLNLRDLTDGRAALPMRRWVAAKVRMAGRQLETGLHDAASCSSLRYRLIVAVLIAKYQAYLDRFRSDRFVLTPHTPLPWGHFLKRIVANVGTVAVSKHSAPPPATGIRSFGDLTPTSAIGRLALRLRLLPSCNGAIVKSIHDCLGADKPSSDELPAITRRFVVAYWIGRASFQGVDAGPHPADAGLAHLAGLVYAHWAIAVMEFELADRRSQPSAGGGRSAGRRVARPDRRSHPHRQARQRRPARVRRNDTGLPAVPAAGACPEPVPGRVLDASPQCGPAR